MKTIKSDHNLWLICLMTAIYSVIIFIAPVFADTAGKVEKNVTKALDIRKTTQNRSESWEEKKEEMTLLYDKLIAENKSLERENNLLKQRENQYIETNKTLEKQRIENIRIQKEMEPFLIRVVQKLEFLIEHDVPFLQTERKTRLAKLKKIMGDIDITIAEKFRKVMEALTVEAEYGNTIEVYQDKADIEGNEVLGNIFRLGRVSMFFLTFDNSQGAYFDVEKNRWTLLDKDYIPSIEAGVAMAMKRRPVEIISLPLGRLAGQKAEQSIIKQVQ